jgi:hypothetical protein
MRRQDVPVNSALRVELLERAGRDQAARQSLAAGHDMREWKATVEPVDRANAARLREIVAEYGWPGYPDARDLAHLMDREPEAQNRARLLAARTCPRGDRSDRNTGEG